VAELSIYFERRKFASRGGVSASARHGDLPALKIAASQPRAEFELGHERFRIELEESVHLGSSAD
jgi:hypothetical protein